LRSLKYLSGRRTLSDPVVIGKHVKLVGRETVPEKVWLIGPGRPGLQSRAAVKSGPHFVV